MTPPLFQLLYAPMYQAPRLSPAGSPAARGPRLRRTATDGTIEARRAPRGGPCFASRLGACWPTPIWSPSRRRTDLDAAEAFYGGVLGLELVDSTPFAKVFDAHGTQLRVTRVDARRRRGLHRPRLARRRSRARLSRRCARAVSSRGATTAWSRTRAVRGPRRVAPGSRGSRIRTATPCRFSRPPEALPAPLRADVPGPAPLPRRLPGGARPPALRRTATDGTRPPVAGGRFYFLTLIVMRISWWSVQTSL